MRAPSSGTVITASLSVEGKAYESVQIISVQIEGGHENTAGAEVELADVDAGGFASEVVDDAPLNIGKDLEIHLGYEGITGPVFSGQIASKRLIVSQAADTRVRIGLTGVLLGSSEGIVLTHQKDLLTLDITVSEGAVSGQTICSGTSVRVGSGLRLNGVSKSFDWRDYEITGVQHLVEAGLWTTTLHSHTHHDPE
ncbi:MAG: hypothetical protein AAFP68_02445 [Pseudomonadota bacterium]